MQHNQKKDRLIAFNYSAIPSRGLQILPNDLNVFR